MAEERQEVHPNLKRGGANAGAGRPKKELRAHWTGIGERSIKIVEYLLSGMEAEVKKAKQTPGYKPKIDKDYLLKITTAATTHSQGAEADKRPPLIAEGILNAMLERAYGDKGETDAATPADQ